MASVQTVYSVLETAYNTSPSTGGPANWVLPGLVDVPVRCMIDTYVPLGTESAGSVIRLFTDGLYKVLPQGANLLKIAFQVAGTTTSLTGSVGDLSSATRYATASTGFASATAFEVSCITVATGIAYVIGTNAATTGPGTASPGTVSNGDNQIIITTGGATLSATTSVINAILYYTLTN
jgi:hypothetical protein